MVNQLLQTLRDFELAIGQHPDFEIYAFKTFEGLSAEKIHSLENEFHQSFQEKDDLDEELSAEAAYFMPYGDVQKKKKLQFPQRVCIR